MAAYSLNLRFIGPELDDKAIQEIIAKVKDANSQVMPWDSEAYFVQAVEDVCLLTNLTIVACSLDYEGRYHRKKERKHG